MTTLYIRMISKAAGDNSANWRELPCPFALVSNSGAMEREGFASVADLADTAGKAQRVVLLLAASDVTLLSIKAPPLSAAKLKAALPGMVEERLISDPSECVLVAGPAVQGVRNVAVVQRAWLENVLDVFLSLGAHQLAAIPSQLCLPYREGVVSAAVYAHETTLDLTLRMSYQEGLGLPVIPEATESTVEEVLQTIAAMTAQAPVSLYVPHAAVDAYRQALQHESAADWRIDVLPDEWSVWLAGARDASLDLATGLRASAGSKTDWRKWRWPMALAALVLIVNVIGLNIDWWRMKSEAETLRASMTQIYRSVYPKDTVIVDPLAQMQQKLAAAQRGSGGSVPDDFMVLAAAFGEAWSRVAQAQPARGAGQSGAPAGIAALEYRDRSLIVRLKSGSPAPLDQIKTALAARNLIIEPGPAQSAGTAWQIRSAK